MPQNEAEFFSKATNTAVNTVGLVVILVGIAQIQSLDPKGHSQEEDEEEEEDEKASSNLDVALLR